MLTSKQVVQIAKTATDRIYGTYLYNMLGKPPIITPDMVRFVLDVYFDVARADTVTPAPGAEKEG